MMSSATPYTRHHPKWYRRRVSVWWWLESWKYTKFVVRELTSLSVAFFALILLWKLRSFALGPDAYARFLARMESPVFLLLNGIALLFVLYHSATWFNLAPKAMVVRLGGRRVPDWVIQGANYVAWLAISALLVWRLRRG